MKFHALVAFVTSVIVAEKTTCKNPTDIVITEDFSGLTTDASWNSYVVQPLLALVGSFDVSPTTVKFDIASRDSRAFQNWWCNNVQLYSAANTDINSLMSTIQAKPCNILSPNALSSAFSVLYGSRRPNIPAKILLLTDGVSSSGYSLTDVDRINSLGGITWICAGVGPNVDYKNLGSICGPNIFRIQNYGALSNSIPQIVANLCNDISTPTTPEPTTVPTITPSALITKIPTSIPTYPSAQPSKPITFSPTRKPKKIPTKYPTKSKPTKYPTKTKATWSPAFG